MPKKHAPTGVLIFLKKIIYQKKSVEKNLAIKR